MNSELSAGVLAYLQRGQAPSPRQDREAVVAVAEESSPEGLLTEVEALVAESLAVTVDWSNLSLGDAGRAVAAEMANRHPELSQEALDALAWNFTFAWR